MANKKTSNGGLIITMLAVVIIFGALSFLGGGSDHSPSAEHFAIQGGHQLDNYYKEFYAPTLFLYLREIYGEDEIKTEFEDIFCADENGETIIDKEYLTHLNGMTKLPVVQKCAAEMFSSYQKAVEGMKDAEERSEFDREYRQKVKGFLVELNKERLRHAKEH